MRSHNPQRSKIMTNPAEGVQYAHPDSPAARAEAEADVMAEADRRQDAMMGHTDQGLIEEILRDDLRGDEDVSELVDKIRALKQDLAHEVETHVQTKAELAKATDDATALRHSRNDILETVSMLQLNVRDAATDLRALVERERS